MLDVAHDPIRSLLVNVDFMQGAMMDDSIVAEFIHIKLVFCVVNFPNQRTKEVLL